MAKQADIANELVTLYPTLPLWWVPESGFAVVFSIVVVTLGTVVNAHGKTVDRLWRSR